MSWRLLTAILSFFGLAINYAMRLNLPILAADKEVDFPFYDQKGIVLGAFNLGYAIVPIPAGILARNLGARRVLLAAGIVWVFCDALTPSIAELGLTTLFICRIGVGVGSGLLIPAVCQLAGLWTPSSEKASLTTFTFSGMNAGPIIGMMVSPQLVDAFGYSGVFGFWSIATVIWLVGICCFVTSTPGENPRCVASGESEFILRQTSPESAPMGLVRMLQHRPSWGIIAGQVGYDVGFATLCNWLPSYLSQTMAIDLHHNPFIAAAPFVFGWGGSVFAGQASDAFLRLERPGWEKRHVRRAAQCLGAGLGSGLFLASAMTTGTPSLSLTFFFSGLFFYQFQLAGYIVSILDIFPGDAGTFMGVSNTFSMLSASLAQPAADAILKDSGSWCHVFGMLACVVCVCSAVYGALIDDCELIVEKEQQYAALE